MESLAATQTQRSQAIEDERQRTLTFDASLTATAIAIKAIDDEQTTFEHHFSTNINLCWQELNDCYSKLDNTPIYVAAIILHPGMKLRYLERKWTAIRKTVWVGKAKRSFDSYLQEYEYKELVDDSSDEPAVIAASPRLQQLKCKSAAAEFLSDDDSDEDDRPVASSIYQQYQEYLYRATQSLSAYY
ncbi:hypothetical protein LTR08_008842 [Meristemomyces frigidus]|nr:hypothetical protein LTR08_008842 [Meristemomyces frigidus]